MSYQGTPCWYELGTSDLDGAGNFYAGSAVRLFRV